VSGIDRDTLRRLLDQASGAAEYKFLFDHLESPAWLGPLVEEGVFNHPPDSVFQGDRRVFLLWPPSRYLVRMAQRAPNEVAEVIAAIPDTDNFRVHDDFLAALRAMPAEVVVSLTKPISRWLSGPHAAGISRHAAEVMGKLADAGHGIEALQIAKRLLRLSKPAGPRDDFGFRDAEPICSQYDYSWILEHEWPRVVATAAVPAWRFIRRLLEVAVDAHRPPETAPHDLAYMWRRTIHPSDQTIPYELKGTLVEALYGTARFLVERGVSDPLSLYGELAEERWDIFRRIGLQLLVDLADCVPTREVLVDKPTFDHICLQHEYMALLRRCFGGLGETDRLEILSWIDAGPDLEWAAASYRERTGADPTPDYLEHRKAIWQRDRLAPVAGALIGEWHDRYQDLIARFGEGDAEPMPFRIQTLYGSSSPLTEERGAGMDPGEWAEFLKKWSPTAGPQEPSPDGLAVQLSSEIDRRPTEFAARAELFRGIWPIYARTLSTSLRNAIKRGERLPAEPVLRWSEWLVDSGPEEGAAHHQDDDPSWTWARVELGHLLSDWMKAGVTVAIDNRETVWTLLEVLLQDQDPAGSAAGDPDPGTQAWNSVRGAAALAAIEYGRWVERSTAETGKEFRGMAEMPELAAALEAHLDAGVDPAPAVRSVYGQQFPNLAALDRNWTAAVTGRIFSWEARPELAVVAWRSYLDWWLPGQPSFELLRGAYELAVDRVSNAVGSFEQMVPEEARLAQHLMLLTLYGELPISLSDGLLAAWYARAGDRLCAQGIEFLGRYLSRSSALHSALEARLTKLWDMRAELCELDPQKHRLELISYGWLFGIPALPLHWRLRHLVRVLELMGNIDSLYFVMEQLVDDVQRSPAQAAQAVRLLVSQIGNPDLWIGSEQARSVIATARGSGDELAAHEARQAVEQLLRLGLEEFRDLA
jgi:hypothetical protein